VTAERLLAGVNVYGVDATGVQIFFNPVWTVYLFIPLTFLDTNVAFQLWRLGILILLAPITYWLLRLYRLSLSPFWVAVIGWLIILLWYIGQNETLVAVGVFLAILFAACQRWDWAGAMIPLMAIKPQTVVLFPFALLWRGRWRTLPMMLISAFVACVSAWLAQPNWVTAWLGGRWGDSQGGGGQTWLSAGILNVLDLFHLPIWLYVVIVAIGLFYWWRYRDAEWRQLAALTLGLGATLTPYIRPFDFILIVPMLFMLPSRWVIVLAPVLILLFAAPIPFPMQWFIPFSATLVFVIASETGKLRLNLERGQS
jgi:hypothetical protein